VNLVDAGDLKVLLGDLLSRELSTTETLDVDYSAVCDSFRGISGLLGSSTMGLPFWVLFGRFTGVGGTLGVLFIK